MCLCETRTQSEREGGREEGRKEGREGEERKRAKIEPIYQPALTILALESNEFGAYTTKVSLAQSKSFD